MKKITHYVISTALLFMLCFSIDSANADGNQQRDTYGYQDGKSQLEESPEANKIFSDVMSKFSEDELRGMCAEFQQIQENGVDKHFGLDNAGGQIAIYETMAKQAGCDDILSEKYKSTKEQNIEIPEKSSNTPIENID